MLGLGLAMAINMMFFDGLEVRSDTTKATATATTGRRLRHIGGPKDHRTGNTRIFSAPIAGIDYPNLANPGWKLAVRSAAWFYLALILCSLAMNCLTYTPVDYQKALEDSRESNPRYLETAGIFLLAALLVAPLLFLRVPVLLPLGMAVLFLRQLGSIWHRERRRCPRNRMAEALWACHLSSNRTQVSRQLVLGLLCLAGKLEVEYFYTFLLLDVVNFSEKLHNVVKAVTNPLESLLLTSLLGVLVLYGYSSYGYFFLRPDFESKPGHPSCATFADCTVFTMNTGLRHEGGIGFGLQERPEDRDDHLQVSRFIYDLSFFVLITTLFLNLLFGIIVDTFGSLRMESQSRENNLRNTAFVSCLDRSQLDKSLSALGRNSGFDWLEAGGQNKWSYMKFILYLKKKDPLNYTGPETAVVRLVNNEDISWMPNSTCAVLQQEERRHQRQLQRQQAAEEAAEQVLWQNG